DERSRHRHRVAEGEGRPRRDAHRKELPAPNACRVEQLLPIGGPHGMEGAAFRDRIRRPVAGNAWTNREPPGDEPGPATEYATHFPSGEKVAAGGNADWTPTNGVTFLSGSDRAASA